MGPREYREMPKWLEALLAEKFFAPCSAHDALRKNEKNVLCLDCCSSFCAHCLHSHRRLLQIRRYMYNDVVRVEDLERLFDLASVQTYTTNSKKVVFIKERSQNRPINDRCHSRGHCHTCGHGVQDQYLYCSISCKVKKLLNEEGAVTKHLRACAFLPLGPSELDESQLSPESILDATSSVSTCTEEAIGLGATFRTAGTYFLVRRRRSPRYRPAGEPESELVAKSRRKQTNPFRSPFC